jgi:phage tail sheath gpL-like
MNITGYQGNFIPSVPAVIAAGAQDSSVIKCNGFNLAGLMLPSVFTGTALTFFVGDSEDGFQASGQINFTGTTTDGDTIEINGVEITFVDADPGDYEVLIGGTAAETASNLQDFLDATEDVDLLACTYVRSGAVIMVTAVVHGTDGNAYTFTKSSTGITLTPAGGTLSGGGFRQLYDSSNAAVSMTVAQGRAYAVNPANFYALQYLKIRSGSVELAARTIIAQLKGL